MGMSRGMRRDATRRDATLRDVLFFAPFLSPLLFQPREERETTGRKGGRVIASSRTTSRALSRECQRQGKEKKGSRLPTFRTHTSTCIPRGKKDEASVKMRRVGVARLVGSRGGRERKGKKGEKRM